MQQVHCAHELLPAIPTLSPRLDNNPLLFLPFISFFRKPPPVITFMTQCPILQDILVPCDPGCLRSVRVEDERCCSIKYDRIVRTPVLIMKGELSRARLRIPRERGTLSCISLPYILILLQTSIGFFDTFALEVVMSVHASFRVKLIIGTHFNKASSDGLINGVVVSKMPLVLPRNRWVQVVFHLSGMVTQLFDLPAIRSIESISLIGTSRILRLMTCNNEDEAINTTPAQMPLFAVPAYAPPIWLTAMPIVPFGGTNDGRTSVGSIAAVTTRSGGNTDTSDKHSPPIMETTSEAHGTLSCMRHEEPLKSHLVQPHFPIHQHSPGMDYRKSDAPTCSREVCKVVGRPPTLLSCNLEVPSMQKQETKERHIPSSEAVSYIRLVNQTNPPLRGNTNALMRVRSVNPVAKGGDAGIRTTPVSSSSPSSAPAASSTVFTDVSCGITGWEESTDLGIAAVSATPRLSECTGKACPLSNQGPSGERGCAAGGGNKALNATEPHSPKSQRLKKMMELGRRPIVLLNRCRKLAGSDGSTLLDGDSGTAAFSNATKKRSLSLGRVRMRKRIKLLKEAQVIAHRTQTMKLVSASEVPIDPQDASLMMAGDEIVEVKKEPCCGYGFGYLGVLHEGGGFETEEGADMEMKGARTLKLQELSEDEELDEDEDDDDDDQ